MADTKNFDCKGYPTAKGMKLLEQMVSAEYDVPDDDHTSTMGRLKKLRERADAMYQVPPIGHFKQQVYELKSISFTDDGLFSINWAPHKAPKKKSKSKKGNKSHAK